MKQCWKLWKCGKCNTIVPCWSKIGRRIDEFIFWTFGVDPYDYVKRHKLDWYFLVLAISGYTYMIVLLYMFFFPTPNSWWWPFYALLTGKFGIIGYDLAVGFYTYFNIRIKQTGDVKKRSGQWVVAGWGLTILIMFLAYLNESFSAYKWMLFIILVIIFTTGMVVINFKQGLKSFDKWLKFFYFFLVIIAIFGMWNFGLVLKNFEDPIVHAVMTNGLISIAAFVIARSKAFRQNNKSNSTFYNNSSK